VAALSGSLERIKDGEIALKHPTVQVFERKARPEAGAEVEAPQSRASVPNRP
jgi:hypothetical protein